MTTSPPTDWRRPTPAVRLGRRSSLLLVITTIFGLVAFGWPLLIQQHGAQNTAHNGDAPWILMGFLPLLLAIVMAELSDGSMDAKAVALLGILAACFAALRVPSPGISGFEPEWFLLVLSARVFGRGFGFVLGAVGLLRFGPHYRGSGAMAPLPDAGGGLGRLWCRLPAPDARSKRTVAVGRLRGGLGPGLWPAHQLLVLALHRFDHDVLLPGGGGDHREPPPLHVLRPDDVLGLRPHPGGHLRHPDSRAGSTRAGSPASRVPSGRLRSDIQFTDP